MDKVQEIMDAVGQYGALLVCEQFDECEDICKEIEVKLRALLERNDLHARIMNIQVDKDCMAALRINELLAYKRGHKDARHAAAEIASGMEPNHGAKKV